MIALTLGFMPLTDCVPLVVAKHLGFFEKWGLEVSLKRQNSWATLRDKLHAGLIDGAHMLAPMPFASALGLGSQRVNIAAPFVLSRQGNGITLSNDLFLSCINQEQDVNSALPLPASRLKEQIASRAERGEKLTFATVYPYSCHYYQLTSWLQQYQVSVEDINLVCIPPLRMVDALKNGYIDGFCVGNPWNAHAVRLGIGVTALTSCDIWPAMPEKVLGMRLEWCKNNAEVVYCLVNALSEACEWLGFLQNRFEAARLMASESYLGVPLDVLTPSLLGSCLTKEGYSPRFVPHYNIFGQGVGAYNNCPAISQGEWIVNQMVLAGHIEREALTAQSIAQIFREDWYNSAQKVQNAPKVHQVGELESI